ncbi:MAG TPA: ATP-binding protein [Burkholderiales bacterium]|nr:ATP-binding protein [Burkholderiales bacterium]
MPLMSALQADLPRRAAPWAFVLSVAMIAVIAFIDYATGHELNVSVLYLAPVFISAWLSGRDSGIAISMMATVTRLTSVIFEGREYSHPFYYFWDAAILFLMFMLFAVVIARLKLALQHADERFVTVLEGLDSAVFVTDADGRLLFGNEQYYRSFGSGAQLLQAVRAAATAPAAGGSPLHAGTREGEFHDVERRRWYLVRSRTIRWVDGKPVRLHRANDITERKQADELSRQQQEKLQMTSRLITVGEMASTLAHEMNQPLAAIANYTRGCMRRLRSGDWSTPELLDALDKTAAQAERGGKIIQRVRAFVARREPAFADCDLNEVIRGVVALIEIEAEGNGVTVEMALDPELPRVRADPVMIEQVVLNLVKNAIEAMRDTPQGARNLQIDTARPVAGAVEVAVRDTGHGVPPDFEQKLATPFYTTKAQGMGLGLHICRSIVEAHAGRLRAAANARGGATLIFSLPVAAA